MGLQKHMTLKRTKLWEQPSIKSNLVEWVGIIYDHTVLLFLTKSKQNKIMFRSVDNIHNKDII